jgi:hypothetical protein
MLCTGSLIWSTLLRMISFHGSPLGERPLINGLARRASD